MDQDKHQHDPERSLKHGDASSEPGGADEVWAAHDAPGTGGGGLNPEGVGLGTGSPSTFEPEEDASSVPEDPA